MFKSNLKYQKEFLVVLFFAVLVGLVVVTPQIYSISKMGDDFQGIYPEKSDDDFYYQARVKESLEGNIKIANPYLFEHQDSYPSTFWLPDFLIATFTKIFAGNDVNKGFIYLDFILPATGFILFYVLSNLIWRDRLFGLMNSLLLSLGFFLQDMSRSPSPQLNFLFILSFFIFFLLAVKKERILWYVLSTLNLGLLFYVYPYYWTYVLVFLALFLIVTLFFGNNLKYLIKPAGVLVGGSIIGFPYLLGTLFSFSDSTYSETIYRLGTVESRFPSGLSILLITLASMFAWFWFRFRLKKTIDLFDIFFISSSVATFLVTNHHIITGKNMEFSSHYLMLAIFSSWFLVYFSFRDYLQGLAVRPKTFFIAAIIIGCLFVVGISVKNFWFHQTLLSEDDYQIQKYAVVLDWLADLPEEKVVIWSNNELGLVLPVYSNHNVFYVSSANFQFISNQEVVDRFLLSRLDGQNIDDQYLKDYERYIWRVHYINRFAHQQSENSIRKIFGLSSKVVERLPQEEIDRVKSRFSQLSGREIEFISNNYHLDYLVIQKDKDVIPSWIKPYLIPEQDLGDFLIYKVSLP